MASISNIINHKDIESYNDKFDNSRITIAKIMDTRSFSRTGELKVWIPTSRIPETDESRWIIARYASPFYGVNAPNTTYSQNASDRANSYGMFFVPPDVGNMVFVFFPNIQGSNDLCYWFACPFNSEQSRMIPGIPYNTDLKPAMEGTPNVKENTKDFDELGGVYQPYDPLTNAIDKQGLSNDLLRGPTSSSIKRESPSRAYGILTPYGNQFIMDDGWCSLDNLDNWDNAKSQQASDLNGDLEVERYDSGIRLRTRDGVQLLLSNNKGHVYMINKDGTAWAELNNDGYIDCWSLKCVSASSDGDINLNAKRNININTDGTINIKAGGDIKMEATNLTAQLSENILSSAGANIEETAQGAIISKATGNIESSSAASMLSSAGANIEEKAGASILEEGGASIEMKAPKIIEDSADISLGGAVKVKTSLCSPSIDVTTLTGGTVTAQTGFTGQLTGNASTSGWAAGAAGAPVPGSLNPAVGGAPSINSTDAAGAPAELVDPQEISKEVTQNVHNYGENITETIVSRLPTQEPYYYHFNDDNNDTVQQPIVQEYKNYQISNDGKAPVKENFPTANKVDYVTPKELIPEQFLPDYDLINLTKDDQFSVFEKSFQEVMLAEGGYVNDPKDPGGETCWGISKRAYPNLDIRNLTKEDAKVIYKRDYWDKCGANVLPEGVAVMAVDFAYNSGVSRAVKMLQRCCAMKETGSLDPITLGKIQASNTEDFMEKYKTVRMNFLQSLSTWSRFGKGWTNRVNKNYAFGIAIDKLVKSEEVTSA